MLSSRLSTRVGLFFLVTLAGSATAHEGHETHTPDGASGVGADPLALALFASGLLVLGAGVYLGRRGDVARTYAMVGVGLGLAGLVGAAVTYLL